MTGTEVGLAVLGVALIIMATIDIFGGKDQ